MRLVEKEICRERKELTDDHRTPPTLRKKRGNRIYKRVMERIPIKIDGNLEKKGRNDIKYCEIWTSAR